MTAYVNSQRITVRDKETLLEAALREGVQIPYSCRVGGCGSCKCRLVEGRVKQLTDTSYLLTDEELGMGVILACRSVPRTDGRVEVELEPDQPGRMTGTIVEQRRLTADICWLGVRLDEGLEFRAGQYARLSLRSLPGVYRNYSFASAPRVSRQVDFFVRKVPGGTFSSRVNDQNVVGERVELTAPLGDFHLREAEGPLLFLAGGSGLAPVLSMLHDALHRGVSQPVTLLFGARRAQDLYHTDEIASIARQWPASFHFIPVVAEVSKDEQWLGRRGPVTEAIPTVIHPATQAYLCGPPGMVDAASDVLRKRGVPREHIHADRFTTLREAATECEPAPDAVRSGPGTARRNASAADYLKYSLFHLVALLATAALLSGGPWITAGLAAIVALYVAGDALAGDDTSTPAFRYPGVLTAQLWLALPLLALVVFSAVWGASPGDPLGFGDWLTRLSGHDFLLAKESTGWGHHLSAVLLTGLMIGMVGTIPGHELTHRTWDRVSMLVGRWLLAFSFDTSFSIEHVYGHHRYVATEADPATAPRGRNVYFHIFASTIKGNVSAWKIEADSLRRRGQKAWSWHNRALRGYLMSAVLVTAAAALGGWSAALFFVLCGLWGKALLEIVNYMEHYGLVRDPTTPVEPRHSWNTNRRVSSWSMFNLTRHSHHHAQGEVAYQDLRPFPDAPMMIGGYLTTILIAMIPPLWHRLMTPRVLQWDRVYATERERQLAARANRRSGLPALAVTA
nr:fatty acid desaturase [Hydrogenophaga intermedia]